MAKSVCGSGKLSFLRLVGLAFPFPGMTEMTGWVSPKYAGEKKELEAVYESNLRYLERILKLCKSRNITFNVVITPVHKNFYSQTTREQRNVMYQFLYDAKREYPHLNILDFFSDSRFSDNDFQDLNHLSEVGADKISKILRDTIKG